MMGKTCHPEVFVGRRVLSAKKYFEFWTSYENDGSSHMKVFSPRTSTRHLGIWWSTNAIDSGAYLDANETWSPFFLTTFSRESAFSKQFAAHRPFSGPNKAGCFSCSTQGLSLNSHGPICLAKRSHGSPFLMGMVVNNLGFFRLKFAYILDVGVQYAQGAGY